MRKFIIPPLLSSFIFSFGYGMDDPLINRTIVSDLEIVVGDASDNSLAIFNFSRYLKKNISAKLLEKYYREDKVRGGNIAGDYRDEIIIAFGKERKSKDIKGKIGIIRPGLYSYVRFIDVGYSKYDDIAIGNVYPDQGEYDEIIVGSANRDTIDVYTGVGKKVASVNVQFERYDKLAAGDVDGDGYDEIILGDASKDEIRIFKLKGRQLKEIGKIKDSGIFDRNDRVAAGDIDGDNIDEIIFVNNDGTTRYFMFEEGNGLAPQKNEKMNPSKFKYDKYSHVAVGDVNSDGRDEIVIAYAKDNKIHVYTPTRELGSIKAGIERYDSIALIDTDSDSVVVGRPIGPKQMVIENQVIAVINEPPKERTLFGKPDSQNSLGKLYASYENQEQKTTQQTVSAISSVAFSLDASVKAGIPKVSTMSIKVKRQVEFYTEKTKGHTLSITIGQNMNADVYEDRAFTLTSTYNLYEYPIISPPYLAKIDGKQQYILISVPVSLNTKNIGIYRSNKHINGYVASYPDRKTKLHNYSAGTEIASWEMKISCAPSGIFFSQEEGTVSIQKSKITHKIGIKLGKKGSLGLVKTDVKLQGNYTKTSINTHKISFEKSTSISVKYAGGFPGCNSKDKQYTIGAVLYYDSVDGHLVLDYYVPEKGSYYKAPSLELPVKPLILDKNGKVLKSGILLKIPNLKNNLMLKQKL